MERLAEEKERPSRKNHWSEHQAGCAEVEPHPNGTLKDVVDAVWNKSLELADLTDEALESLRAHKEQAALEAGATQGSSSGERFIVGPWTTG